MAEWQTKSGVWGTKEADFFLQCLDSAFAAHLAKDTKSREIMAVIIYSDARSGEAGFQFSWGEGGDAEKCLDSKYSAQFYCKRTGLERDNEP